jgi:hypothetical protein
MAVDFSQFTPKTTAISTDYLVGYDQNASGGEKKFTLSTIANAVSGIIAPSFAQTPAFTGTFKNKIINGNFDIWQRGTSLGSGTGARYLADRFTNGSAGTTYTAAQSAFALGQTSVPNEPKYYISTAVTSVIGASNNATLHQHIEGVRSCAGKTVTLSFYAKSNASRNIAVELYQNFGTGGSPSTSVSIPAGLKALTTSWQKFTVTVNIPSISGKVLGTAGNDSLVAYFWFDAGSSFTTPPNNRASSLGQQSGTFDIAQVQFEEGSEATPFEQRPIGTELSLCQRYYEQMLIVCQNATPAAQNFWASGSLTQRTFSQVKRAYPVLTTYPFTNNEANNSTANYVYRVSNSSPPTYSNILASSNINMAVFNNSHLFVHGESGLTFQPAGSFIYFFLYIDAEL